MNTAAVPTNRRTLYIPQEKDLKIRLLAALKKQSVNEFINEILNEALKNTGSEDIQVYFNANE
jgi:hypothetical protein